MRKTQSFILVLAFSISPLFAQDQAQQQNCPDSSQTCYAAPGDKNAAADFERLKQQYKQNIPTAAQSSPQVNAQPAAPVQPQQMQPVQEPPKKRPKKFSDLDPQKYKNPLNKAVAGGVFFSVLLIVIFLWYKKLTE